MIARITGTVVEQCEKGVVVETNGIGYLIYTPVLPNLGEYVTLHTHLVIKDDCHELYGFMSPSEKSLFSILISVSGVGPKTALQMLTLYPMTELVRSIRSGDSKAISVVPGIGKKTAEKVIIDLKDKLASFEVEVSDSSSDLVEALLSLGYKEAQIRPVIGNVDVSIPIEKQITTALQFLQKK
jgi:holliday junction DNA helicase RuvA